MKREQCAMTFAIVIPTLNEASEMAGLATALGAFRDMGCEVIVADGGSNDGTQCRARRFACLIDADRGRGRQMNAGAAAATAEWLLFLHADTRLPADAPALLQTIACCPAVEWGFFPVRLDGPGLLLRIVETMMNWRSRTTHIATGDQALFVRRRLFQELGGFAEIPLMEDIELSKRLRGRARPLVPNRRVVTSSRRWRERGTVKTILTMWTLRAAYACGASPAWLARHY